MQLQGFHHLTAISADAPGNFNFYTRTLGMRLVKKTVNQDDTSAYHLFYADGLATPGTDITFFDWPASPEHRGTHSITRTGLRVPSPDSLQYWANRFQQLNVTHSPITTRDNRQVLDFEDPEHQRLSLIADPSSLPGNPWPQSPVPPEHQIRGLGPITISVPKIDATHTVLTDLMEMRQTREYASTPSDGSPGSTLVRVYEMATGGPSAELHVAIEPDLPSAISGAGGVHHVAFRTPNVEEYQAWADRLNHARVPSSGPVDRFYFQSLYFREPNGILFEIATDGPGFATDEPLDQLGQHLSLPPFLEPHRAQIEANLKPLTTTK
ncbi:MAG TPA: ring-cleaving dioxygenase [Tepidisphaeraceae bacterium]|jgi:glyoxalase family protein|nr:ring-cleaving dioxygenase [Tepidisphaeraceae bacterium]